MVDFQDGPDDVLWGQNFEDGARLVQAYQRSGDPILWEAFTVFADLGDNRYDLEIDGIDTTTDPDSDPVIVFACEYASDFTETDVLEIVVYDEDMNEVSIAGNTEVVLS